MFSVLFVKVEAFGMLGFDVFVIVPNHGQIFLVVASGIEVFLDATAFFLVVDEAKNDRDMSTFSNDIEAFFPMFYGFSGAFGTDDKMGVLVLAEHVDHLLHKMVLMAAVDGDAAQLLQYPAEDRLEELFLHHHLELDAVAPIEP